MRTASVTLVATLAALGLCPSEAEPHQVALHHVEAVVGIGFVVNNVTKQSTVCDRYVDGTATGQHDEIKSGESRSYNFGPYVRSLLPRFGLSCAGVGGDQLYTDFKSGGRYAIVLKQGALLLVEVVPGV